MKLGPTQRRVIDALDHLGPSTVAGMRLAGLSDNAIRRSVASLAKMGIVRRERRDGKNIIELVRPPSRPPEFWYIASEAP